jgi:ABC-type cobalamin/Fe3+-siderophores transport system ATPase subunit
MHEILPKKITRSISRYQAKARLLALAMASQPALASAQDARSQAPPYCFDLTWVVARNGRTLVLAIHQLSDAARVCDRFVLLAAGSIRGIGTLAQLRAQAGKPAAGLEEVFLALT